MIWWTLNKHCKCPETWWYTMKVQNRSMLKCSTWRMQIQLYNNYMYIYIYKWNLLVLYFWGLNPAKNKAFSNQNMGLILGCQVISPKLQLYIFIHASMTIPWKSKTKQRMVFRMIHIKDPLLPMGKVWSLDSLGIYIYICSHKYTSTSTKCICKKSSLFFVPNHGSPPLRLPAASAWRAWRRTLSTLTISEWIHGTGICYPTFGWFFMVFM